MMHNIKMQDFLHCILYVLNSWIAKFNHFVAFRTDEVIMLLISIRFFVLRQIFAELMFAHQIARYEQIQGIVHGSPADPVVFILHIDVERFHIKMPVPGINLLQYGVPLRGLPQLLIFKVCRENLLYFLENFCI
jgi:hypothetical protein